MPLVTDDKRMMLIICGEHFSHGKKEITPSFSGFGERSAQAILQLYRDHGDGFLEHLNGWFAGIVFDVKRRRISLFNDRYGMGRIYYHEGREEFIFASEAKSLLRIRPALRDIDVMALAEYLQFDCVMDNKSLFKGVSLLPGGSVWSFGSNSVPERRTYFDFCDWENQPSAGSAELSESFAETVSRVFPSYMENRGRVALSLTAGLDTRTILAAREEEPLPCYTFGGLHGETFDVRTARKLAEVCGQPFEAIRLNEKFLRNFPDYARQSVYVSDGTHGPFGAHDVYFNQMARSIAPVRLTGKFGSEVIRTRKIIPTKHFPRHLVQPWVVPFLEGATLSNRTRRKRHPISGAVAEEIPWYEFGRVSVEQSAVILRTPYMDNELVKLMYRALPSVRESRELQGRFVTANGGGLGDVATDMGRVWNEGRGQVVRRLERNVAMALAKTEYIYLYSAPHWLTRLDRKLERWRPERMVIGRHKYEAYRIWLRSHFGDFVRETLLNSGSRCGAFFEKGWITKVVARHLAGTHNYLMEIDKMLTIELVCALLLKVESPGR
jgi:asparagine synthase (glutamine-hydrolysing)